MLDFVIEIDGNIGVGKSTQLECTSNALKAMGKYTVIVVPENVDEWCSCVDVMGKSKLAKFYADPKAAAFEFQVLCALGRKRALEEALALARTAKHAVIVVERSMEAGARVFGRQLVETGQMSESEYNMIIRLVPMVAEYTCAPIVRVYLRASPQTCKQRLDARNREGESVGIALLTHLDRLYTEYMKGIAVEVNANQAVEQVTRSAMAHICAAIANYNKI